MDKNKKKKIPRRQLQHHPDQKVDHMLLPIKAKPKPKIEILR